MVSHAIDTQTHLLKVYHTDGQVSEQSICYITPLDLVIGCFRKKVKVENVHPHDTSLPNFEKKIQTNPSNPNNPKQPQQPQATQANLSKPKQTQMIE